MKVKYASIILSCFLVFGCSEQSVEKKPIPKQVPIKKINQSTSHRQIPVRSVQQDPWQNDSQLSRDKVRYGTPVLMSKFEATLPDPIMAERDNIALAARYLSGAVVLPGEVFSLNNRLGRRTAERGFKMGPMYQGNILSYTTGGGICKVASVLYNAAVLSNLTIVERHPHSMTVPYVPPGQDATLNYGTKDVRFKNTTSGPILIWSKSIGDTLHIAFFGVEKPPAVRWNHEVLARFPNRTEYVDDPNLPRGKEEVVFEGAEGITVHSWVDVKIQGNWERKDFGVDKYMTGARRIKRGSGS